MTITQTNLAGFYVSFFNRAPDSAGLAYWVDKLDKEALSLEDISKNWTSEQAEGLAKYPVALTNIDFITQIYQAALGRAPDAEGLAYWQDQLTNKSVGRDVFWAAVINGAKANSSAQGVLDAATLSNKAAAGIAFADKGLNDLTLAGQVVASINSNPDTLAAAQAVIKLVPATAASVTPALITLLSKTFESIINLNAKAPGEVGDLATYLTAVANQIKATTVLSTLLTIVSTTVTNAATNSAALDNPVSLAGDAVAAATPSTGGGSGGVPATPSFTLTAGVDVLNGDGGNNVFTGDNTQTSGSVGAGDQLNGGAGTDTFNYFSNGGVLPVPQLNSVENVNLITAAAVTAADFTSAVGLQQVTLKNASNAAASSITLGAGVAAGLDNAKVTGSVTFAGPATQTAATLNVVNGSNVAIVNVDNVTGTALTTLNVVSAAGAANTIGSLQSTGTETTLNVSGAGDLTINAVGASLTTINASAATGKTSINAAATTGNVAYTGGAADDTIKFGASLTTGDVVNGGTGVNTLGVTTGASLVSGLQVTNVQTLDIGSADTAANTYDVSKLADITTLKVGSAINGTALSTAIVNNLAKGATVEIGASLGLAVANTTTINVKDAGAGSANDVIAVKLAAAADFATTGTLIIADIETVNLSSTTTGVNQVAHTLSVLNVDQATTVNVDASTHGLVIGDLNAPSLVSFDASASVKAVSVSTGTDAFTATDGTAFILGQGSDTLNLGASTSASTGAAFVITGGKGGDAITLSTAVAGNKVDVLKYAAGDSFAGAVGTVNEFDAVTNFHTAEDKIDLTSFGFTGTVATIGTTAATIGAKGEISAANTANFFGTGANQHGVVTAAVGADTWVYVDANKDGSFQADTDLAIQLVGVAAPEAADYVFA